MSNPLNHSLSRRSVLAGAFVGGTMALGALPAEASSGKAFRLTVIGTADLHSNVLNWNYFKNQPYSDRPGNQIGLAQAATLIRAVREERGIENTVTLDAGDTIQGTPLAYYFAKISPAMDGVIHPMAAAMNEVGYDAVALGNHEFNYGIPLLRSWESQLAFPLLGANVHDHATGAHAFKPFVIKKVKTTNGVVRVGMVGFVTPGCAIWDRANVEGRLDFNGIVEEAKTVIPQVRAAGADIVVVSCHSGMTPGSSYGNALPFAENASQQLAEEVPGIDAILVGHAHAEIPERWVENQATKKQVLLSEPKYWGMRVTVMDLDLTKVDGTWTVAESHAHLLNANSAGPDAAVVRAVDAAHQRVVAYVNQVIGSSTAPLKTATGCWEDVPAIDAINYIQAHTIKGELAGTASAGLPVLSIAAAFSRAVDVPAGPLTVRDVAGLYIYDNTLMSIKVTGAQVKDYLEWSARYYKAVSSTTVAAADLTNAVTPLAPNGTPDYNYDVVFGLDAPLTYTIDVAKPVGQRIVGLSYAGKALDPAQEFAMAINNYRQSGGGSFPHVATAPVLTNSQQEIRQRIIDYVTATGVLDASLFARVDWSLTVNGAPLTVV
ncbi:5'-nucleotidase C-terminal domain-containing protein [Sinomonas notoginsengisoli]|uniref:bifunctional metallophosphatase/5'-nucleotidase n=1 Tax=Sinomonas notoginsengisoli TaxID=1457311 RepID=UPI001F1770BC|nr:5'-nucleotidase C-terminal domain-containing protein [Sinomonas notoginsengisoli]